ncbi:MAG: hypothetical protein KDD61_06645 [Bdellovibrionales bacterium]|nr:hypothetical protein [Bdellovibrionales bacterium]
MSRKIKRTDCHGCYNEDYHSGLGGKNKCWSFDNAEMKKGRLQHRDTLPKDYRGQWKLIPDCYIYRFGFVERQKQKGFDELYLGEAL